MIRGVHQLALYGVGSLTCFALALATERAAAAAPFVSSIHAMPLPSQTKVFDQRTRGGQDLGGGRLCTARTRILLRSEQSLSTLKTHYAKHKVRSASGDAEVNGKVYRVGDVKDLVPEWDRHRKDGKVYLVEFISPGTPGTEADCKL
ncbi:hypothetical protein EON79_11060 [bacterium]|nr:MAG: hypothetical protein EON79_11060 [bacterium]